MSVEDVNCYAAILQAARLLHQRHGSAAPIVVADAEGLVVTITMLAERLAAKTRDEASAESDRLMGQWPDAIRTVLRAATGPLSFKVIARAPVAIPKAATGAACCAAWWPRARCASCRANCTGRRAGPCSPRHPEKDRSRAWTARGCWDDVDPITTEPAMNSIIERNGHVSKPSPGTETGLVADALALLGKLAEASKPLAVRIAYGEVVASLTVQAVTSTAPENGTPDNLATVWPHPGQDNETDTPEIKPIHRRLLAKANAEHPVKARALILAAGYKVNSNSRGAVTELVRWGYLARDLANRYLPTQKRPA